MAEPHVAACAPPTASPVRVPPVWGLACSWEPASFEPTLASGLAAGTFNG
jgi:hypothetical protein